MALVEIEHFPDRIAGELARGRLEVDGIGAVLFDEGFAAIGPGAMSGCRLMVDEDDYERALATLGIGKPSA